MEGDHSLTVVEKALKRGPQISHTTRLTDSISHSHDTPDDKPSKVNTHSPLPNTQVDISLQSEDSSKDHIVIDTGSQLSSEKKSSKDQAPASSRMNTI